MRPAGLMNPCPSHCVGDTPTIVMTAKLLPDFNREEVENQEKWKMQPCNLEFSLDSQWNLEVLLKLTHAADELNQARD